MACSRLTLPRLLYLMLLGLLVGCLGRAGDTAPGLSIAVLLPASEKPFWEPIARAFTAAHPRVHVELVEGPQSTGLREDLYTASLLAGDPTFDLVYMDVTWTSKFASAGWLHPLDSIFPDAATSPFLPAAIAAGVYEGQLYRLPVRTDVGLLYFRRDWLEAAGLSAPESLTDLLSTARRLQSPPERWGWVWPGKQYEGLVCFFVEILNAHGGFWIDPGSLDVGLDRSEAVAALEFLLDCRGGDPISPPGVTTYQEEESRRLFQDGRAVFLRNWPYVWRLAQREDSPLRGRIGVQPIPPAPQGAASGTLGGWGLGISVFSRHKTQAVDFIRFAVSLEGQRLLCGPTGYAPSLRAAYDDSVLLAENPFLPEILTLHEHAVLRPVIPHYALASDILQRHLSAALSGATPARAALAEAARETRLLLRVSANRASPRGGPDG